MADPRLVRLRVELFGAAQLLTAEEDQAELRALVRDVATVLDVLDPPDGAASAAHTSGPAAELACSACDGDGEVSHGSCGVPDCEHAESCPTCGGTGKLPTPEQVAELRIERDRLVGDLMVAEAELAAYKERCAGGHPFDLRAAEDAAAEAIAEFVEVADFQYPHTLAGMIRAGQWRKP